MAKRFVDTELDDKPWFNGLSCRLKCAVQYVFRKCDSAGIWEPNFVIAAAYVGEGGFTEAELLAIDNGEQFEKLPRGKIFVVGFCDFQYGKLSEECKPHRPVIQKLKKLGLYERVLKGYQKGFKTLQEKETDKEEEKDKGGAGENFEPVGIVPDMAKQFTDQNAGYFFDQQADFPVIAELAVKIHKWENMPGRFTDSENVDQIRLRWGEIVTHVRADTHLSKYSLSQINKHFSSITQSFNSGRNGKHRQPASGKPAKPGTGTSRIEKLRNLREQVLNGGKTAEGSE